MKRREFLSQSFMVGTGLSLSTVEFLSSCAFAPPKDEIDRLNQEIGLYEEWLMGLIALKNIKTPLLNQEGNLNPLEEQFRMIIKKLHYNSQNLPFWRETYYPPELVIFDSKAKNAFTLPGGFVCITTGMMDYAYYKANDKAEGILASIIAHELGHLYLEHPKRHYITMLLKDNLSRQYREMAEGIKAASGDFSNDFSKLIIKTILKAKEQGTKGYQSVMEYQADQSAVYILDRAELTPEYLVDAMGLLKHHMGGIHGSYEERVGRVRSAMKQLS